MSYYFFWDSESHYKIAKRYGFESLETPFEGTFRNYHGIDEKIHRIHQYLKVLKFGYGRATDHACEEIRNGRLTREEGARLVGQHDLLPLSPEFLHEFAKFISMPAEECIEIMEKYRNKDLWEMSLEGTSILPDHLAGIL